MTLIRRVPLDFDWPLNKGWDGFLLPSYLRLPSCSDCNYSGHGSSGFSAAAYGIDVSFYATSVPSPLREQIAWHDKINQAEVDHLLAQGRLQTWQPGTDGKRGDWVSSPLTASDVNARQAGMGLGSHDALNRYILVKYRCARLGIDMNCPTCQGTTHVGTPEQVAAYEAWAPTDPPTGEGWQAWEDVSEGSPISPVFPTDEALVDWFASPASADASSRYPLTRAEASALVKAGASVGSGIAIGGALVDGDRAVAVLSHGS